MGNDVQQIKILAPEGCPMGRCPTNKDFGPGWGHLWVEKTEIINAKS